MSTHDGASNSLHIVCPDCSAINRIPETRIKEQPKCGKCSHILFNAQPVELSAANFQKHISRSDIALVVDFWAPGVAPAK